MEIGISKMQITPDLYESGVIFCPFLALNKNLPKKDKKLSVCD